MWANSANSRIDERNEKSTSGYIYVQYLHVTLADHNGDTSGVEVAHVTCTRRTSGHMGLQLPNPPSNHSACPASCTNLVVNESPSREYTQ